MATFLRSVFIVLLIFFTIFGVILLMLHNSTYTSMHVSDILDEKLSQIKTYQSYAALKSMEEIMNLIIVQNETIAALEKQIENLKAAPIPNRFSPSIQS